MAVITIVYNKFHISIIDENWIFQLVTLPDAIKDSAKFYFRNNRLANKRAIRIGYRIF